jgi:Zn-dependent peptidase ImmA (M78 family)
MIRKRIEEKAKEVLRRFKVEEAYVPVDTIAEKLGLRIQKYDFGEDVSGVLVIDKGIGTIGINPSESLVRTRFTIAHEIGHYILHGNKNDSLFIDKNFKVHFRDQSSSTGEIRNEQEANAFAAALFLTKLI